MLPRLEQRPDLGYGLGQFAARSVLTRSLLVNLLRLGGIAIVVAGLGLIMATSAGIVVAIGGVALLITSVLWRPATKTSATTETWSEAEQRVTTAVTTALEAGTDLQVAIGTALKDQTLAIDYGTTSDGRSILVPQTMRRAHQVVTGGAGSGKSKFLATQAGQAAVLGGTLGVIDPHEELLQDIVCSAAHLLVARGCVIIWPGEALVRRIYPWNPLWTGPGREPWQAADLVVSAVKRVWQLTDANTYIIDVLKHTSWALAAAGWTLLEGARFLTDPHFRQYIAAESGVVEVQQWVAALDALSTRDRQGLIQTTIVRLNRLNANPHLQHMLGCGVTDPRYRAALAAEGLTPIVGADLVTDINRGIHLFAVLPKRTLGEDQYVLAGLVQSALLSAALSRRPNDPAMPELEVYLDEAGAYANAEGLGVLLAQARKYKFSAVVAMQGLGQAEDDLAAELERNTAIKVIFKTDQPEEMRRGAEMLFSYEPLAVKLDTRQKVKGPDQEAREIGTFQTYGPEEQRAFAAGQIGRLPSRMYLLKVRDAPETPLMARSPDYTARSTLPAALQLVNQNRNTAWVTVEAIARDLAFRRAWLNAQGYQENLNKTPLPPMNEAATVTTTLLDVPVQDATATGPVVAAEPPAEPLSFGVEEPPTETLTCGGACEHTI